MLSATWPRQTTESMRVCATQSITVPTRAGVGSLRRAENHSGTLKKEENVNTNGSDGENSVTGLKNPSAVVQRGETVVGELSDDDNKG